MTNQVILAPILLYFIVYGLLSKSSIYTMMNMDQLLTNNNIIRLPDLRRTNILIIILILSVFIDSFIKTIIIVKLTDTIPQSTIEILKNFPYGIIVFIIGITFLLMNDQTDPADIIIIGFTILLLFIFCLLTVTFYIVLFAQNIVKQINQPEQIVYPMPIFQTIMYLCAIIYVILIYRVILTNDTVTLPLAGMFIYILLSIILISNVMTFIMKIKFKWNINESIQSFCLPSGLISIISLGIILLTYLNTYPEWIMYPIPFIYLYWILTNFTIPSNYAIVKTLAMKWI